MIHWTSGCLNLSLVRTLQSQCFRQSESNLILPSTHKCFGELDPLDRVGLLSYLFRVNDSMLVAVFDLDIVVDFLLDSNDGLVGKLLVLEHYRRKSVKKRELEDKEGLTECQFFKGSSGGLGVHEKDEEPLERDPSAVACHEFPANSIHSNWVNVVRKEKANLAPNLFDTDTAGSDVVWEQLDKVSYNVVSKELGYLRISMNVL